MLLHARVAGRGFVAVRETPRRRGASFGLERWVTLPKKGLAERKRHRSGSGEEKPEAGSSIAAIGPQAPGGVRSQLRIGR